MKFSITERGLKLNTQHYLQYKILDILKINSFSRLEIESILEDSYEKCKDEISEESLKLIKEFYNKKQLTYLLNDMLKLELIKIE